MMINENNTKLSPETSSPERRIKNKTGLENLFESVGSAVAALAIVALILATLFRVVNVDGESMTNTLQHKDTLLISGTFYTPDYGDIVVVTREESSPLIKRVIGLAGDRIRIADGVVYRNDQPLTESYTRDGITPDNGMEGEITVPAGEVFVMGDNRCDSYDSRMLGTVSEEDILGRALFRLMPSPKLLMNGV